MDFSLDFGFVYVLVDFVIKVEVIEKIEVRCGVIVFVRKYYEKRRFKKIL